MEDTISRQAAIDEIRKCRFVVDAIERIRGLPSAQSERKTGQWEEIEVITDANDISGVKTWASRMRCNRCGFIITAIEGHIAQYEYCPNCGADMIGEEHETGDYI